MLITTWEYTSTKFPNTIYRPAQVIYKIRTMRNFRVFEKMRDIHPVKSNGGNKVP
jgi:hypothetical protein